MARLPPDHRANAARPFHRRQNRGIVPGGRVPLPVGRAGFKAAGNAGESTSFLANSRPCADSISIGYPPFWQTAPGLPEHVETTERHRMPYLDTGRISLFFEDARSGGIPVLLLHELGGSSESWREVIPSLTTDRRVIAADFRCAGRSEKPPGSF